MIPTIGEPSTFPSTSISASWCGASTSCCEGIQLRTTSGSVLHYRFVPGFDRDDHELDTSWGLGKVTDDLGSEYDHSGAGGWGADSDGIVRNGDEDLGRGIPNTARWVEIEFRPAHSQQVAGSQVLKIRLDMLSKSIYEVMATDT